MKKLILSAAIVFSLASIAISQETQEAEKKSCCKGKKSCAGKDKKACSKDEKKCCKAKSGEAKPVEAAPAK